MSATIIPATWTIQRDRNYEQEAVQRAATTPLSELTEVNPFLGKTIKLFSRAHQGR